MVITQSTAVGIASAVLALSKRAWKLGSSLSKFDQNTNTVDTTIKNLAGEIKSLSNECDLVYTELEEVVSRSETVSPQPYNVDDRVWVCLATQVEDTSQTLQNLELVLQSVGVEGSSFVGQAQRQRKLDETNNRIASFKIKICRHINNLRATLLLINTILVHIAPYQADKELVKKLDKLQDMVEKLQKSSETNPHPRTSHTEATLMQCARETIERGMTMYEASLAAESVAGGKRGASSNIRVVEWVSTLESIRRDQQQSDYSDIASNAPSVFSGDETHTIETPASPALRAVQACEVIGAVENSPEDDLEADLAKAALDTGTTAFKEREWEEADSLLQEALRILQKLPKQQRAFCNTLSLQYKLAVCAYHMQEPAEAEEALMSLVQQSASTNEERVYIYNAAHLLSILYIRMGQLDRARSECEKALQARRRLLGKQSNASLESTALMAHIYSLLGNRARAKSYLAMIPETCRDEITKNVEVSLNTRTELLDSSSLQARGSISEESDLAVERIQSRLSASSLALSIENRPYGTVNTIISQLPTANLQQSNQRKLPRKQSLETVRSITMASPSFLEEKSDPQAKETHSANGSCIENPEALANPEKLQEGNETKGKTLSRKEILDKIGCQPRDRIEEAICDGDHSAFDSFLKKKQGFWRSKLRKRVRSERVTALHFAALFGEIDMVRRLLNSSFNINEVPFGYTTSLTPLKFAIGARQVDMVEFLIANGARPSEPDTWSTLAGQLMNRSWLLKTMSEVEKEYVPDRIMKIMSILLKNGWDVNVPFETSGGTVLHQAVSFWTGSYTWDLNLRAAITSFLCVRGANPFQINREGKTPYDVASASGHQDLLLILERGSQRRGPSDRIMEPVELST